MTEITLSAVVPTRNRPENLLRLLRSLAIQTTPLLEVIISDAGDVPIDEQSLRAEFPPLNVRVLRAEPSVCAQRNRAIRNSSGSHIFLCDDDMDVPPEYLHDIVRYFRAHPSAGAVSGRVVEAGEDGQFPDSLPTIGPEKLFWNWVFQKSVWADVNGMRSTTLMKPLASFLRTRYARRGNTITRAGFPLVTQWTPVMRTAFYGLGAAVIRREWLAGSPFDERLDEHGIGDNYGVAMGFPGQERIIVLRDNPVYHHRSEVNRLAAAESWRRRILALDYFTAQNRRSVFSRRLFLLWSLAASMVEFAVGGLLQTSVGPRLNSRALPPENQESAAGDPFTVSREKLILQNAGPGSQSADSGTASALSMFRTAWKTFWLIARNRNPYIQRMRAESTDLNPPRA